jgi:hypothetical protein
VPAAARRLIIAGSSVVAIAVATAGWRAVTGRRWEELEAGLLGPVKLAAVVGVVVPLLIAARAALGHRLGWPTVWLSILAIFAGGVFAVDVVQRAVNDGAPVVDVLLPLTVVVGASMMLFGIVRPGARPLR